MQMKKIKEERASMAVYVAIVLITFLLLLTGIYFSSVSVRKSQLVTIMKIKESYESNINQVEQIYQRQLEKMNE